MTLKNTKWVHQHNCVCICTSKLPVETISNTAEKLFSCAGTDTRLKMDRCRRYLQLCTYWKQVSGQQDIISRELNQLRRPNQSCDEILGKHYIQITWYRRWPESHFTFGEPTSLHGRYIALGKGNFYCFPPLNLRNCKALVSDFFSECLKCSGEQYIYYSYTLWLYSLIFHYYLQ